MFFQNDRNNLRQHYSDAWQKHLAKQPLTPLEKEIVDVIKEHAEYHDFFGQHQDQWNRDFDAQSKQSNPFLHLGMHLALREQVGTDRPQGIATITRSMLLKYNEEHQVEHLMMDCLGEMLWDAQQQNTQPNEQAYLEALKKLL